MLKHREVNAADAAAPVGAYAQAVEVSGSTRTLYVSGQVGMALDGTIPDDIAEQARLAWQNLAAQLAAAGMTLDNVVKVTTIIPELANLGPSREARTKALGNRRPAATLIVAGLANPAWKIEIEAVAVA